MKSLLHLTLLIFASNIVSMTSSQSFSQIQNLTWPYYQPTLLFDGFYYIDAGLNSEIFQLSNREAWLFGEKVLKCQGMEFIYTTQNEFFCYTQSPSSITWYQFSPSNFSILDKFEYNFGFNTFFYTQSNIFINFMTENKKEFNLIAYNTATGQYECSLSNLGKGPLAANFIGAGYLYPNPSNNQTIYFFPCGSGNPIQTETQVQKAVFANGFINFNQNTVFIGSGSNNAGDVYFSQAGLIDLLGIFHTGPEYNFQIFQYNDTHFMGAFPENGYWQAGVFTIGSTLNFVLQKQVNLGILSSYLEFQGNVKPIQGETFQMSVSLSGNSAYIYDITNDEITNTFSDFSPFLLANGSWVNLTIFGYFIQSPNEPIYFIRAYYSTIYVDPALNDIWTLYITDVNNKKYGYPNCTLYHYSKNTSTISQFDFNSCPEGTNYTIGDVTIDNQGNPVVTLFYQAIYVINSTGYHKVLSIEGGLILDLTMNFETNIGVMVVEANFNFNISQFFISNGSLFNTSFVELYSSGYTGIDAQKINEQYFLLATCNLDQTRYTIWDGINQVPLMETTLEKSFIILGTDNFQKYVIQFPVSGIVSANYSNGVDAITWGNKDYTYIYYLTGQILSLYTPNEVLEYFYQINQGNFWTLSNNGLENIWRNLQL